MSKTIFNIVLAVSFLAASNVRADWVNGEFYPAEMYRFLCTSSSDKSQPYQKFFEMTITGTDTGVAINFYANDAGAALNYDDNKFKDWFIVDHAQYFDAKYGTVNVSGMSYNSAINLAGTGVLPATYYLDFASQYSWTDFAMGIESGNFLLLSGHVQEIPQTLNKALFTWDGVGGQPVSVTPEPATILMFGAGLAALPFARRLRRK